MGIRFLLQPWWLRTVYCAALVLLSVCAALAVLRWQRGGTIDVPLLGWLLIVVGVVVVSGLISVAMSQGRDRYVQALRTTRTPEERSQAITAVWRGPAPTDPDVRRAAELLARVQLDLYDKNRRTLIWAYPLVALALVAQIAIAVADDQSREALVPAVVIALLVLCALWAWISRRRLQGRIAVLANQTYSH
jgi:hypothetical protein